MEDTKANRLKEAWVKWLEQYGAAKFYESFMKIAQDAKSTCVFCGEEIYLDIAEGGGCPDWRTIDGDYGCSASPDTNEEGTGSHQPEKLF
jgi:hypothetical protein